ncbi:ABC-2 transporter permease [Paenibacillus sp. L3-i20]|uniref:ABC-2 transporter permease n=1 Tax=Paenibacillus sp. L3-i20 TaxID=2905833 RepID=UPI001EDE2B97|nr:ABC-2 transporter permease [Paenibacillus sp. L3-i20]GKU80015.1 hypothetical protein L3i20_v244120 [Paenibacillus sp. L3-i20]
MVNLLRKDFIAIKSSIGLCFFYLVVFSAFFIGKDSSFHIIAIYTAFASIGVVTMVDIKNYNHNFLVTLPVSRKQIVKAKYVTAIMITILGIIATYAVHMLVKQALPELNKPDYLVIDILVPVIILLLLISIYMPLFYSLSKKGAGIINGIFILILIALAQPTAMIMQMINEKGSNIDLMIVLISAASLLLFIASYYLTVYLFTKKDL